MKIHVTQRQLDAYFYFVDEALVTPLIEKGSAAAIGNFCQESGENLDSTMFRAHPDASGGVAQELKSGGIAEWLGPRKTAYIDFAERAEAQRRLPKGALLNDLFTQCDFVLHELKTDPKYASLYHQLTNDTGRSIATLTINFMMIYERPKLGPTDGRDTRIDHAQAVFDRAQLIKAAAATAQAAPGPDPQIPRPEVPGQVIPTPETPAEARFPEAPIPMISATSAGRRAAEHDHIADMLTKLRAERADIDAEITVFERMDAELGNLLPAQDTKALPSPAAEPAVITERNLPVNNTVLGITNWKTSLGGIAAILTGLGAGAHAISTGDLSSAYASIPAILSGLALMGAKDNNVTGGTVPQTAEARSRSNSPIVK